MQKAGLFQQYMWLLQTIYQAKGISFRDINKRWTRNAKLSGGVEMHRNTFNRHKQAIEEIFDINIVCDKANEFKYYIEDSKNLKDDSILSWLLSSMTVHSAVQNSANLQNRILLENIPSGLKFLQTILDAMNANLCISFTYCKYGEPEGKRHEKAEPYCLKLYKQRWYLLVRIEDNFRFFSLDRIESLEILSETFQMNKDFDAEEFLRHNFGVFLPEQSHPQKVVLRAFKYMKYYLRDLPFHHSQKEIGHGPDYADFSYYLYPTNDFLGQILRYGDVLKVLEPQSLQDKMKETIDKMQKNYE